MAEDTVVRDLPASLEAMAAVLVDEAAVDGVLQLLVSLARASVHGADEVSVSAVCSRDIAKDIVSPLETSAHRPEPARREHAGVRSPRTPAHQDEN